MSNARGSTSLHPMLLSPGQADSPRFYVELGLLIRAVLAFGAGRRTGAPIQEVSMRPNVKMTGDELLMSQTLRMLERKEWRVKPDALVPFATWDVVLYLAVAVLVTGCLVVAGLS